MKINKRLPFILNLVLILNSVPLIAYAQETQPAVDLDQCVAYFTRGGMGSWIGGGLVVLTAILGTFTKASWLGIVRAIGKAIQEGFKKK